MDSVRAFLEEFKQVRNFKAVIPHLVENPEFRIALFREILVQEYPYSDYASWIAQHFYEKHPELFEEMAGVFRDFLFKATNHSIQRNLTHIFGDVKLPMEEDGEFLELLFRFLKSSDSLPALKYHSLRSIELQYVQAYPELIAELKSILDLHKEDNRPSVQSMIRHFYKRYSKQLTSFS